MHEVPFSSLSEVQKFEVKISFGIKIVIVRSLALNNFINSDESMRWLKDVQCSLKDLFVCTRQIILSKLYCLFHYISFLAYSRFYSNAVKDH